MRTAAQGPCLIGAEANVRFPARPTEIKGDLIEKRKRFPVEHIVAVLKETDLGTPVADLIRNVRASRSRRFTVGRKSTERLS